MVNPYKDRMLIEYNIKKEELTLEMYHLDLKHLHLVQLGERSYI